jgi:Ca-activated chloride channel family protein
MSITFTHPYYLWAFALVPLIWFLAWSAPRKLPLTRQRISLILRTLILSALILALSGMELRRPVDNLTVVFLVDVSDSMPGGALDEATEYVRQAVETMPDGDQAAIVLFGKEALVERTASNLKRLDPLSSVPIATRTNVAEAIQLGLALFPDDTHKRLLLVSDGQPNEGDARAAADLAAARNVVLDTITIGGGASGADVQLTSLEAPGNIPLGQRFELVVRLDSTQPTTVRLRVFGDNTLIFDQAVNLPDQNPVRILVEPEDAGFQRYRAVVEGADDTRPQNNEATAYTEVTGPPRIAIITTTPDDAAPLAAALTASAMTVDILAPNAVPQAMEGLIAYDSLVLLGVEAPELPPATMELIPQYVRDLGHGLVMVGGPEGYGAGQYLRTPVEDVLPVDMEVRPRNQQPNVALVLAVDKSGSMGRCHCDDPNNAQQQQQRPESGLPKVDIAKDAIIQATGALGSTDYVGVVAFDDAARWALETQRFPGLGALENAVAPINANGGTNIFSGLNSATESLAGVDARVKHIILLTDGWSSAGDYKALADQMAELGITLSVVAAGSGSAQDLDELAIAGGGRYYPAATMEDVPQIFLQETVIISGRYIIEEPFYPTLMNPNAAILTGLPLSEGTPALIGYNGTTLKPDANEVFRTSQGDPLLATRRYGVGRTVAWTSDLSNRWAQEWVGWGNFREFATQLVAWSLPDPVTGNLQVRSHQEGGSTVLDVTARDDENRPVSGVTEAIIIDPSLESTTVAVPPVGAGEYEVALPSDEPGVYFVTVTQRDENGNPISSSTRGIVVPYSPEYRLQQVDEGLMASLAAQTGGLVRDITNPEGLFVRPPVQVQKAQPLWFWLVGLLLVLFPFDVAVRRVLFGQRELDAARVWVQERLARRSLAPADGPKALGTLFEAKERATWRSESGKQKAETSPPDPLSTVERGGTATPPPGAHNVPVVGGDAGRTRQRPDIPLVTPKMTPPPSSGSTTPPDAPKADEEGGDTLSKLRQAKEQRRRGR